jgi:hypothetical protein
MEKENSLYVDEAASAKIELVLTADFDRDFSLTRFVFRFGDKDRDLVHDDLASFAVRHLPVALVVALKVLEFFQRVIPEEDLACFLFGMASVQNTINEGGYPGHIGLLKEQVGQQYKNSYISLEKVCQFMFGSRSVW